MGPFYALFAAGAVVAFERGDAAVMRDETLVRDTVEHGDGTGDPTATDAFDGGRLLLRVFWWLGLVFGGLVGLGCCHVSAKLLESRLRLPKSLNARVIFLSGAGLLVCAGVWMVDCALAAQLRTSAPVRASLGALNLELTRDLSVGDSRAAFITAYSEIFQQDTYSAYPQQMSTVLDIGDPTGLFAVWAGERVGKDGEIFVFEDLHPEMVKRNTRHSRSSVHLLPYVLTDRNPSLLVNGVQEMVHNGTRTTPTNIVLQKVESSGEGEAAEAGVGAREEEEGIGARRLDFFADQLPKAIDVVRIDVRGMGGVAPASVLRGFGNVLARVGTLVITVGGSRDPAAEQDRAEIQTILTRAGFDFRTRRSNLQLGDWDVIEATPAGRSDLAVLQSSLLQAAGDPGPLEKLGQSVEKLGQGMEKLGQSVMQSIGGKGREEEVLEWSEPGEYSLHIMGSLMFVLGGFFGTMLLAYLTYAINTCGKRPPANAKETEQEAPLLEAGESK